ncbi:hypothetical protein QVD17_02579 [Tagetes erecta]|uniref:Uncharacterized protein n=1 Tax=Tagetes erecta TaxID=13708 RepID=A0AAD8LD16_TARER|nr:hypothetical protein QVD17_02579 [Tagetes erecta]
MVQLLEELGTDQWSVAPGNRSLRCSVALSVAARFACLGLGIDCHRHWSFYGFTIEPPVTDPELKIVKYWKLVLCFPSRFFMPIWNHDNISNVQALRQHHQELLDKRFFMPLWNHDNILNVHGSSPKLSVLISSYNFQSTTTIANKIRFISLK